MSPRPEPAFRAEPSVGTDADGERAAHPGLLVAGSVACALFVLAAIAVEVLAGQAANSPEPATLEHLVPLGWPQPARVLWWLGVAAAGAGHRILLDRAAGERRWLGPALLAAPFAIFAVGVGLGTSWSTWH